MKGSENLEQLTRSLIKSRFSEYYKKNISAVAPPRLMEQREFGFLLFTEGVMLRHRSFKQVSSLRRFIETANPSDVYYSAAYYMNPEAPMDKKGWVGSDLIFDIDADHINTECKKRHDRWSCNECGHRAAVKPLRIVQTAVDRSSGRMHGCVMIAWKKQKTKS